jgi:hypothetical protein
VQSLRGILIAIRRIITTEWFERHPRALTTDTYGRKKTLSKSGTFYWESIKGDSFPETNFLYEFLMKSSGLLSTFASIFSEAAAKLVPVWLREPGRLRYSWRLKKRGVLCSATRNALDTIIMLRI